MINRCEMCCCSHIADNISDFICVFISEISVQYYLSPGNKQLNSWFCESKMYLRDEVVGETQHHSSCGTGRLSSHVVLMNAPI